MKGEEENEELSTGTRKFGIFSVGALFNLAISVLFVAIIFAALVVIGTIGTIQNDLSHDPGYSGNNSGCFLFSSCVMNTTGGVGKCTMFSAGSSHACSATMVWFAFIVLMSIGFIISLVVKAILKHDLNWTLYVEVPILVVAIVLEFIFSIIISIGLKITCDAAAQYNTIVNNRTNCGDKFPNAQFTYYSRGSAAQNSSWFTFLFLAVGVAIFIARLVIFYRRRKKGSILQTLQDEEDDQSKAV